MKTEGKLKTNGTKETNEIQTNKAKRRNKVWHMGKWNIRSIKGEEHELRETFKNTKPDILTITKTKKKEKQQQISIQYYIAELVF